MPMKFPGIARISLRFKLTLWMTLIFLVIQLSLVLVLQLYQHRSVDAFRSHQNRTFEAIAAAVRSQLGAQCERITHGSEFVECRNRKCHRPTFKARRVYVNGSHQPNLATGI